MLIAHALFCVAAILVLAANQIGWLQLTSHCPLDYDHHRTSSKVLSFNTFLMPEFVSGPGRTPRIAAICKYLQSVTAKCDAVMLQEVYTDDSRQALRACFAAVGWSAVFHEMPGYLAGLSSGLAVATRFPPSRCTFRRFSQCASVDCLSVKGMLSVDVAPPRSKRFTRYINVHLQDLDRDECGAIRRDQMVDIRKEMDSAPHHVLVAGDFNIHAGSDMYVWAKHMFPGLRMPRDPTFETGLTLDGAIGDGILDVKAVLGLNLSDHNPVEISVLADDGDFVP